MKSPALSNLVDINTHIHLYPNAYADFQCQIKIKDNNITFDAKLPYDLVYNEVKIRFKNIAKLTANEYRYDYAKDKIYVSAPNYANNLYIHFGLNVCFFLYYCGSNCTTNTHLYSTFHINFLYIIIYVDACLYY